MFKKHKKQKNTSKTWAELVEHVAHLIVFVACGMQE